MVCCLHVLYCLSGLTSVNFACVIATMLSMAMSRHYTVGVSVMLVDDLWWWGWGGCGWERVGGGGGRLSNKSIVTQCRTRGRSKRQGPEQLTAVNWCPQQGSHANSKQRKDFSSTSFLNPARYCVIYYSIQAFATGIVFVSVVVSFSPSGDTDSDCCFFIRRGVSGSKEKHGYRHSKR